MNIVNETGEQIDVDPRAESIKIVEAILADMKSDPNIPTIVIIRRASDKALEQHVCGPMPDVVHALHSAMCNSDSFENLVELAMGEHYMCQAVRSGVMQLPPNMHFVDDNEDSDLPESNEDQAPF